MDKFVVRAKIPADLPRENQLCPRLERSEKFTTKPKGKGSLLAAYEIYGKILPEFKPSLLKLMLSSYSEFVAVHSDMRHFSGVAPVAWSHPFLGQIRQELNRCSPYVSAVDFDSKGIYLAAVNSAGLLSIYEFETIYCNAGEDVTPPVAGENNVPYIYQTATHRALEAIKWNPSNEDEVACVAAGSKKVYFYDVARSVSSPSEILRVKERYGWGNYGGESVGFFDLTLFNDGSSRILACGRDGHVHIWDRRASSSSCAALSAPALAGALNSVQLSRDEQMVYSGSEGGCVYSWDLRGGKDTAAFVTSAKAYTQPLGAVKIETLLRSISSLRYAHASENVDSAPIAMQDLYRNTDSATEAQTDINTSAVHAISLSPACGKQLAFHLNCGWSGVLDMSTLSATHIHCPPPPWIDKTQDHVDSFAFADSPRIAEQQDLNSPASPTCVVRRRRPVWLHSWPVYAVGSGSECKVHMLDFTPGSKSRYSLEHYRSNVEEEWQVELLTSAAVVAMAAHPLNDTLVAGCKGGKLSLIGQRKTSINGQKDE